MKTKLSPVQFKSLDWAQPASSLANQLKISKHTAGLYKTAICRYLGIKTQMGNKKVDWNNVNWMKATDKQLIEKYKVSAVYVRQKRAKMAPFTMLINYGVAPKILKRTIKVMGNAMNKRKSEV